MASRDDPVLSDRKAATQPGRIVDLSGDNAGEEWDVSQADRISVQSKLTEGAVGTAAIELQEGIDGSTWVALADAVAIVGLTKAIDIQGVAVVRAHVKTLDAAAGKVQVIPYIYKKTASV